MHKKRMELKEMLLKKKIDPIHDPNLMRSSHDVRAAPPVSKQFRSKERMSGVPSSKGSQGVTYGLGLNSGSLSDFNGQWYRSVGNVIVGAMFFNLYYPLLEAGMYWALRA